MLVVRTGATDHAEAIKIEFDPNIVTYGELVGECYFFFSFFVPTVFIYPVSLCTEFFYRTHDPTTINRQGGDTGTRTFAPLPLPFSHTQT